MKPRLLDLFCGAGGAAAGYHRAGFEVVGVDNRPQPRYPFEFHEADALEFAASWYTDDPALDFAAIHASPPCQAHSTMRAMWNAGEHADLIPATRTLLVSTGLPYVIENVAGARSEMESAVDICGASVGLRGSTHDLARHRLFETNWPLMVSPCAHGSRPVAGIYGDHVRDRRRVNGSADRGKDIAVGIDDKLRFGREMMGIDWMTWAELSQAIPPRYTELVGAQLLAHIRASAPDALVPARGDR